MTDKIPTIEVYRGVGLHDSQSEARLRIVRAHVDRVHECQADTKALMGLVCDVRAAPEARLFAGAVLTATFELLARDRVGRAEIDLEMIKANLAGLDSVKWRDKWHYGTVLEPSPAPGMPHSPRREVPLEG